MLPSVAGVLVLLLFAVVQEGGSVGLAWLAVCSLIGGPGGVPRRPAAVAAGARRRSPSSSATCARCTARALQATLARTLGDPGLVVAYRLPSRSATPTPTASACWCRRSSADRAIAPIEHDGVEVAALDLRRRRSTTTPSSSRRCAPRRRSRSRTSACRRSPQARLVELQASRERLVEAGDAERRRLERNLHDGAQQRLVAIALQLRLLQARHPPRPGGGGAARDVGERRAGARRCEELRELARGIHPAVLEHGLAAGAGVARDALDRADDGHATTLPRTAAGGGRARGLLRRLRGAGERRQVRAGDRRLDARLARRRAASAIEIADDGVGGADAAARVRAARPRRPRRGARRPPARHEPAGRRDGRARGAAVRVVIADDSLLVREGIVALLRRAGIDVVAEASTRRGAAARGRRARARRRDRRHPDAADVHRRGAAGRARDPRRGIRAIGIVILSQHVEVGTATRAAGREPGAARLPAQGPRRPTSTTSSARCAASSPAARRSTRRSSRGCSRPTARTGRCSSLTPREREVLAARRRRALEQGHRRPARDQRARRAEARHRRSSASSTSRPATTTTAASWRCSPYLRPG